MSGGPFTGESFSLHDQFWGKSPGAIRTRPLFQSRHSLFEEPLAPHTDNLTSAVEASSNFIDRYAFCGQQDPLGANDYGNVYREARRRSSRSSAADTGVEYGLDRGIERAP